MVIEKASVSDNWVGGGTEQANKAGSQALNRGLIMRPGCCRAGQTSTQSSEKQVAQSLPGGQSSPRHRSSSSDGDEDDLMTMMMVKVVVVMIMMIIVMTIVIVLAMITMMMMTC